MNRLLAAMVLAGTTALSGTAWAQTATTPLPDATRAMINAAIATDDEAKVATVVELAKQTNPGSTAEIDAMNQAFAAKLAEKKAKEAAETEAQIRSAGVLDNWSGSGELGAFRATGNSSNTGVTAGVKLARTGIDWTHKLSALADYQRSNGVTTREQFIAAYEPNYRLSKRLYAYGLAQYERDKFQGYASRYTLSGGLGYHVIDQDNMQLSVKGGPAWRKTNFVGGGSDSSIAAMVAGDYWWQISERLRLTQNAAAYFQSGNTSLSSLTGLEAKFDDSLSARLSYGVEHETDPPLGAKKTDTLTRVTLIYGF